VATNWSKKGDFQNIGLEYFFEYLWNMRRKGRYDGYKQIQKMSLKRTKITLKGYNFIIVSIGRAHKKRIETKKKKDNLNRVFQEKHH